MELGCGERAFREVMGRFRARFLVEAFGALEARYDAAGLLLLVGGFASVAVYQIGALAEQRPLGIGLVVGPVLDPRRKARFDAGGLGLGAGSLGAF